MQLCCYPPRSYHFVRAGLGNHHTPASPPSAVFPVLVGGVIFIISDSSRSLRGRSVCVWKPDLVVTYSCFTLLSALSSSCRRFARRHRRVDSLLFSAGVNCIVQSHRSTGSTNNPNTLTLVEVNPDDARRSVPPRKRRLRRTLGFWRLQMLSRDHRPAATRIAIMIRDSRVASRIKHTS